MLTIGGAGDDARQAPYFQQTPQGDWKQFGGSADYQSTGEEREPQKGCRRRRERDPKHDVFGSARLRTCVTCRVGTRKRGYWITWVAPNILAKCHLGRICEKLCPLLSQQNRRLEGSKLRRDTVCGPRRAFRRVRRSEIRNSQAPSLLTRRFMVRILFGEPTNQLVATQSIELTLGPQTVLKLVVGRAGSAGWGSPSQSASIAPACRQAADPPTLRAHVLVCSACADVHS
jgi:hypothetical protein